MWEILGVFLMFVKKKLGYIPHFISIVCLLIAFISAAIYLTAQSEPKPSLQVKPEAPLIIEPTLAPVVHKKNPTPEPNRRPEINPGVPVHKPSDDVSEAESNSEPMWNYNRFANALADSFKEAGLEESSAKGLVDKIRQNLRDGDGSQEKLLLSIKEEFPGISDDEAEAIRKKVVEALVKVAKPLPPQS